MALRNYLFFLFWLLASFKPIVSVYAQKLADSSFIKIEYIDVHGHAKTKKSFVLRELTIHAGDSLLASDLERVFRFNELRLLNSRVFYDAKIQVDQWLAADRITICVEGQEPGYWDALPSLELADRNFNVWWRDYNHSLRRINLGGYIRHNNLSGHGDQITLLLQFGYTNKYELIYRRPFINKAKTIGIEGQILYARSKEVNYLTLNNRQQFFFNPFQFTFFRRRATLQLNYKPKNNGTFWVKSEYFFNSIRDTISSELHPNFFGNGVSTQRYTAFTLAYQLDTRDIRPYPIHGRLIRMELSQQGIPKVDQIALLQWRADWRRYIAFGRKISFESDNKVKWSITREEPPFMNNQALGYFENYLRGYEFYVIDGLDFALLKQSLHYQLWNKPIVIPDKWMPFESLQRNPLKAYLSFNMDLGYANDPYHKSTNPLNNRPLMGYGIGLDFVARYNSVLRIEISRNDLGETGYFLHFGAKP